MEKELGGLVLSRRRGQSILIGDDIVVTVVRTAENAVRFHIAAPREMNIVRTELKERTTPIQGSNDDLTDLGRRAWESV